jgi:hypothetical protein
VDQFEYDRKLSRAIFIVTSGRSGGTLLRAILAGHAGLFSPPELNLLPFENACDMEQALGPCPSIECGAGGCDYREGLQRAVMEVSNLDHVQAAELIKSWVEDKLPIRMIYHYLQDGIAPRTLVDKSPMYTLRANTLGRVEKLFEKPLYIHLVRHPMGAIAARIREGFPLSLDWLEPLPCEPMKDPDPFSIAERFWWVMNENALSFLKNIPPERKHLVTFERLVSDPVVVLTNLCKFLEIPFEQTILDPYSGNRMLDGPRPNTRAAGGRDIYKFDRVEASEALAWRNNSVRRPLCSVTSSLASRLGYEEA